MRTKKRNDTSAIDWLLPEVRKRLLALLLLAPDKRWYLRDIERRTGCAIGAIRRELTGLAKAQIVIKSTEANRTYYQANTECPFFAELAGLLRKTAGLADVLREALQPLSKKTVVAFVYGSFAANAAKASSDVDLMVIGFCGFGEVIDAIGNAQEKIGREVNATVFSPEEWQRKLAAKHHFVTSVSKAEKIFIMGSADDLARPGR